MYKFVLIILCMLLINNAVFADSEPTVKNADKSRPRFACDLILKKEFEKAFDFTVIKVKPEDDNNTCVLYTDSQDMNMIRADIMWAVSEDLINELFSLKGTQPIPKLGRKAWRTTIEQVYIWTNTGQLLSISITPNFSEGDRKKLFPLLQNAITRIDDQVTSNAEKIVAEKLHTYRNEHIHSSCTFIAINDLERVFDSKVIDAEVVDAGAPFDICSIKFFSHDVFSFDVSIVQNVAEDDWEMSKITQIRLDGLPVNTDEDIQNLGKSAYWAISKSSYGIIVWTKSKSEVSVTANFNSDLTADQKSKLRSGLLALVRAAI